MKEIIPIMHCFDNNYVIPAAVSFYSMLENANQDYFYKLYVLHSDITKQNQDKLKRMVSDFENADLEFIEVSGDFDDLFSKTTIKGHYSKEMFYKFLAPSTFEQYDKIIITDVDVVFLDDISAEYTELNPDDDIYFSAFGFFALRNTFLQDSLDNYLSEFNEAERKSLIYGAGYYIFNLKKMREDGIEQRCIDFANDNAHRIKQPEQDTLNIVCYPHIKMLKPNSVVCTYMYDLYKSEEDYSNDALRSVEDVAVALKEVPVQLHYATSVKPWLNPTCTKAEVWYSYLSKTPFYDEQMARLKSSLAAKKNATRKKKFPFSLFTTIKDGIKTKIFPREPKFVIASPVTQSGGGPLVLQYLCRLLIERGYDAKVFPIDIIDVDEKTKKQLIKGIKINKKQFCSFFDIPHTYSPSITKNTIVIYPEIINDNFLKARNVVWWFLHKPGHFTNVMPPVSKSDLCFTYSPYFNNSDFNPDNRLLKISYDSSEIFYQTNFEERSGKCYIIRKGKDRDDLPKTFDGPIIDDLPDREIAKIFNAHKYCISYDTITYYCYNAAMCGAIPIVIPEGNIPREEIIPDETDRYGVGYGFTEEQIEYAIKTRDLMMKHKTDIVKEDNQKALDYFLDECSKWLKGK